jgi:hypothetical protein
MVTLVFVHSAIWRTATASGSVLLNGKALTVRVYYKYQ